MFFSFFLGTYRACNGFPAGVLGRLARRIKAAPDLGAAGRVHQPPGPGRFGLPAPQPKGRRAEGPKGRRRRVGAPAGSELQIGSLQKRKYPKKSLYEIRGEGGGREKERERREREREGEREGEGGEGGQREEKRTSQETTSDRER